MNPKVKQWLPILLCCLPGVALVLLVEIGGAVFGVTLNGPLGLDVLVLATLICPLSMGWMMWRAKHHNGTAGHLSMMANCCRPGETTADAQPEASVNRLAELRERREALERELAELRVG